MESAVIWLIKQKKLVKLRSGVFKTFCNNINEPAIHLYLKNGFKKVKGIYEEKFDNGFVLHEFDMRQNFDSVLLSVCRTQNIDSWIDKIR